MGKLVLSGTLYSKKTSLDVSKLHTGLYSLVLNSTENKLKRHSTLLKHTKYNNNEKDIAIHYFKYFYRFTF